MKLAGSIPDFDKSVVEHARKDFPLLEAGMTVGQALDTSGARAWASALFISMQLMNRTGSWV